MNPPTSAGDSVAGPGAGARRGVLVLALALAAIGAGDYLFNAWIYADYLIDDTFISLRYAQNLADGHGLVFNPGERVEGYTNFLFVLLAALAIRIGTDPVAATRAVAIASAVATLFFLGRMERFGPRLWERPRVPAPSLLLLLPLQAFAYWSVASFETMLFTALLSAAVLSLMRESAAGRGHGSAVLFVALALTRPEGVFLFAASNLAFWLADSAGARGRQPLHRYALNAAIFALGFGPYFLWRYLYYGRLLPNTFYAKVTGGTAQLATGLQYMAEWAAAFPLLAATALLPLALLTRQGREAATRHPPLAAVTLIALAHTAYVALVGGDFMPFFRFFVPIMPLACLLIAWTLGFLASASARSGRLARAALVLAFAVDLVASHATEQPYRAFVAYRTALVGSRVGKWFAEHLEPHDLIAVNTAGALPYMSRLPTIDMLGLTDAAIAERPIYIISSGWAGHRKGWGAYVLERRPRVILWYNSAGLREPFYLGDHELADNPYFRFFYRAHSGRLPAPDRDRVVARFAGTPFGTSESGEAFSGDLALRATIIEEPFAHTVLYEGPTVIHYFEFDARDADLWPLSQKRGQAIGEFVDAVATAWSATAPTERPDPAARAQVEQLCEQARRQVEAGNYDSAKEILGEAARRNATVRSPLVYQYIANVAVMTGDLFVALAAQKEALRLAPDNELYRRNLTNLLTVPYKQASVRSRK